jgi:uncharacterized protein YdhG (YjbR/CyaY superfamily)
VSTEKPATPPAAYLARQTEPVQQRLAAIIAAVEHGAPGVAVSISYGILKFSRGPRYLYAGAWKHHIGIYPIYPDAGDIEPLVAAFRAGKDTLQLPHSAELPLGLLEKIAAARL